MLILLWGLGEERPLAAVRTELDRLGVPTVLVDQRDTLATEVRLSVGSEITGSIRVRGRRVDLAAVTGLYLRPHDVRRQPDVAQAGPASAAWQHALLVQDILWSWAEITPAVVVNRPGAMAANSSKPYQLALIQRLGFTVPETLITTDPRAAKAFWERHGVVVYKSISSVRSIVSRLGPAHVERLADITHCPTQFQQYVPGRDYRVHVVGTEIFACEIVTDADDYRYPNGHSVEIRACHLPSAVVDRCRRLAHAMQLPVAGVDLRRTEAGDWYCFEVNPSPAFTYYQRATGQPIAAAIARLLAAGPGGRPVGETLAAQTPT